jgi:PPP family 3-phenylpropionic acid transporter
VSDKRAGPPARIPHARNGSLYYLLFYLGIGSYVPFLYVYFSDLGLSGGQVGLLATLSPVVAMLFTTSVASLADRKRKRVRITQVALAGSCVTVFLLRLPASFGSIVPLVFFLAVFSTPSISIADGLIARMAQRNRLNFGGMRLWGSLGFAISALGCGALWQAFGFETMFIVGSLLCLPPILLAGRLEEGPAAVERGHKPVSQLLRDRTLVLLLAATVLAGISTSLSGTFGGIYARSLGGGNTLIGAMGAFGALAELPTMFFSNRISERISETNAVLCSYGLMGAAFLGYALTDNPDLLLAFAIVRGLGYGLWLTSTVRLVTRRTPEQWASTAQGLLTICLFGLAPLVAGPLGGLIYDSINPAAVFGLATGCLGMAGVVMLVAGRRARSALDT